MKNLLSEPVKAVVLAAGRGTRMGALTDDRPKPMLIVEGRPMIEHVVRRIQAGGIEEILLVVGYRREYIMEHFAKGFPSVRFAVQEVPEGTGAALKLARGFVGAAPFLLTFGDIMTSASNYSGIAEELARGGASAVVGVRHTDDPWQGAAVYVSERGNVLRMVEKPPKGTSGTHWNSAGLYAFTPAIFDDLDGIRKSPRSEYELPTAVERMIARGGRATIFQMQGHWRDVGRPEDLTSG